MPEGEVHVSLGARQLGLPRCIGTVCVGLSDHHSCGPSCSCGLQCGGCGPHVMRMRKAWRSHCA